MKNIKSINEFFFPESEMDEMPLSEGELKIKGAAMNFLGEVHNIPDYTKDTDMEKAFITLSSIFKKYMKNQAFLDYLDEVQRDDKIK